MDIHKIGGLYGNMQIPSDLRAVQQPEKRTLELPEARPEQQAAPDSSQSPIRPRQDAPLEDISLSMHKSDGYGSIGRDSDIRSLDMQKAISDMQRDKVLQQYNFFVGSARNMGSGTEDGIVIVKPANASEVQE